MSFITVRQGLDKWKEKEGLCSRLGYRSFVVSIAGYLKDLCLPCISVSLPMMILLASPK